MKKSTVFYTILPAASSALVAVLGGIALANVATLTGYAAAAHVIGTITLPFAIIVGWAWLVLPDTDRDDLPYPGEDHGHDADPTNPVKLD